MCVVRSGCTWADLDQAAQCPEPDPLARQPSQTKQERAFTRAANRGPRRIAAAALANRINYILCINKRPGTYTYIIYICHLSYIHHHTFHQKPVNEAFLHCVHFLIAVQSEILLLRRLYIQHLNYNFIIWFSHFSFIFLVVNWIDKVCDIQELSIKNEI